MPARKPKPEQKPQFERFIETAEKIGAADTDEELPQIIQRVAAPKKVITQHPSKDDPKRI